MKTKEKEAVTKGDAAENLSLFPAAADLAIGAKREAIAIDIQEIEPDPENPRKNADSELTESIRLNGVLQPITVRPNPDPAKVADGVRYRIVYGERRFWGTVNAGRKTIPAFIEESAQDEALRLIRQVQENEHKRLDPMDEAQTFKRIQQLTNASINQLVAILHRPKSTIGDRIALAEAPAAFQPLFASGHFTAAAAPIVRKFAEVPNDILEKAVKVGREWWQWRTYLDQPGKSIPLDKIEHVLNETLLGGGSGTGALLPTIDPKDALSYQGGRVVIGKKEYAIDSAEYTKVLRKRVEDEQRSAAEKAKEQAKAEKTKGNTPATSTKSKSSTPPVPVRPSLTPAEKKAKEKVAREAKEREELGARFKKAEKAITAAAVAGIKKAPPNRLVTWIWEQTHGKQFGEIPIAQNKATEKLLARGKTSDDLVRFVVLSELLVTIDQACDPQPYNDRERNQLFGDWKDLGFGDLTKLLDEHAPVDKKADAKAPTAKVAAAKKAKGKKK